MTASFGARGRSALLRPRAAGGLAGITGVVLTVVVVSTSAGAAGAADPPETDGYEQTARITSVGKPMDLLLHPESGKLYVGADTVAGTTDGSLAGVYVIDPESKQVLNWVRNSPGSTGQPAQLPGKRFAGPLPGDGAHYLVGLRGIAAAKDGDTAGRGGWLTGTAITQAKAGAKDGTVVVVRGTKLEEVAVGETSVTVERSLTLPAAGGPLAVDTAAGQIWVADNTNSLLRRVDSAGFALDGKEIPLGAGVSVSFLEWDTERGVLWAGRGAALEVYDISSGKLAATFEAKPGDFIGDVAVDPRSDQAFAVWQDFGNPPEEGDGVGQLSVYDTATLKDVGKGAELPGYNGQLGNSSIAVTPGGDTVFVASPADASLTTFQAPVPPSPSPSTSTSTSPSPSDSASPSPSLSASPTPSGGTPDPDPGDTGPSTDPADPGTIVPVDGPTADGGGTDGGGTGDGSQSTTGGGALTTTGDGSLASTGTDVLLPAAAGTAALLAAGTAAVLWRRRTSRG